jgi:hypothetical protein
MIADPTGAAAGVALGLSLQPSSRLKELQPHFRNWPEAAYRKSRCEKETGAFGQVGRCRAGTAARPPRAGTLGANMARCLTSRRSRKQIAQVRVL